MSAGLPRRRWIAKPSTSWPRHRAQSRCDSGPATENAHLVDTPTVSENVEFLRRSAGVFNAGDLERYLDEFVAPDVVWQTSAEDPDAATHEGRKAYGQYIEQWTDSFERLHGDVEEWID